MSNYLHDALITFRTAFPYLPFVYKQFYDLSFVFVLVKADLGARNKSLPN
jgi:hypothetical protein